jgi:hypothetical protein|eukprot:COSAG06_NODE_3350_length_5474_cov_2.527628_6_plen_87_part_00
MHANVATSRHSFGCIGKADCLNVNAVVACSANCRLELNYGMQVYLGVLANRPPYVSSNTDLLSMTIWLQVKKQMVPLMMQDGYKAK